MATKNSKKSFPRKKTSKKNGSIFSAKFYVIVLLVFGLSFGVYHYREAILYYFSFKTRRVSKEDKVAQARIYQLLHHYKDRVFGFDVSQFQGAIQWSEIDSIEGFKLNFVFVRATAGIDKTDSKFKENWDKARQYHFIRGAYHYYRPDENSLEQAKNFIATVQLQKGDFPPVLDIEKLSETQSSDSLKVGLRRWLDAVDKHYKVKPIIYTNEKYYNDFLKNEFKGYLFWIANYNFFVENIKDEWTFWQFTEKAKIKGIDGSVDVTIYNGTPKMLYYLTNPN